MINQYELLQKIGEGQFGKVYKALDSNTSTLMAIKKLNKARLKRKREFFIDASGKR